MKNKVINDDSGSKSSSSSSEGQTKFPLPPHLLRRAQKNNMLEKNSMIQSPQSSPQKVGTAPKQNSQESVIFVEKPQTVPFAPIAVTEKVLSPPKKKKLTYFENLLFFL